MTGFLTYNICITMCKISILLLYRRIFDTARFKAATIVVGVLCVLWFIAESVTAIAQCSPVEGAWNKMIPSRCINLTAFWYGLTASNLILDIIILCMPMFVIWRLKLATRQKIVLSGMFMLGGL